MNQARRDRIARNESSARSLNERAKEVVAPFAEVSASSDGELAFFVCECGREGCCKTIELQLGEYEQVRANPTRLAVVPAHQTPEVERVVSRRGRCDVVEKPHDERGIATAIDPR